MTSKRIPACPALLLVFALAMAACGQNSGLDATSPATAGGPVTTPGGANASPGASVGVARPGPSVPAIDLANLAGTVDGEERAIRAEDRAKAGLAKLGPGAVAFASAIDANQTRVLGQVSSVASRAGQIASLSMINPSPVIAAAPGEGYNSFLVFGVLVSSLDDFIKDPRSGTVEDRPETVEVEGNTGTIRTTMTLKVTVSGSHATVDLTIKTKGEVLDRATGASLYKIDSEVKGTIDLNFCPDAGGKTTAHVNLASTETYSGAAGSGRTVSKTFTGDVGISVGDDARIIKVEGTATGSEQASGGSEPGVATRQASSTITNDGAGNHIAGAERNIAFSGEGTTSDEQVRMWGSMSIFTEAMTTAAAQEAEKLWRDGKCVELIVDPGSSDVDPDATKDVKATLHHKFENRDLDKTVVAMLTSGVKSIDPAGSEQPSPATVTYTAGPEDGDYGNIAFKSTSNRGIAEKTVTFTVRSGWTIRFSGSDDESFGPVSNHFDVDIIDLKVHATDGVLSGTGEMHLKGTVSTGSCNGSVDQKATTTLTGTIVGTGPDAKLQVVMRSRSVPGPKTHMTCIGGGSADLRTSGYAERFGGPLLNFLLPVAGGTVNANVSSLVGGVMKVMIQGVFTVTRSR